MYVTWGTDLTVPRVSLFFCEAGRVTCNFTRFLGGLNSSIIIALAMIGIK